MKQIIANTKNIVKLSDLPETVEPDGVKTFGPTSYETQDALLSHYLHSLDSKHDMDGQTYVPQHRERIMIVGFDKERYHGEEKFVFPEQHQATRAIKEILDPYIDTKFIIAA